MTTPQPQPGRLSFIETISALDVQPRTLGHDRTIVFYNDSEKFHYCRPDELVDGFRADDSNQPGDCTSIALGGGELAIGGEITHEDHEWHHEGQRHHRGDGDGHGNQPSPHRSGGTSFTPTPRLVWM